MCVQNHSFLQVIDFCVLKTEPWIFVVIIQKIIQSVFLLFFPPLCNSSFILSFRSDGPQIVFIIKNNFLFILGPCIAMITALMAGVVIPWGGSLEINGVQYSLQIADIDIGILYVFAVVSIGVYGIMIGGWASNNKFSLLGAIRASAQMISYELPLILSTVVVIMMVTGSNSAITLMVCETANTRTPTTDTMPATSGSCLTIFSTAVCSRSWSAGGRARRVITGKNMTQLSPASRIFVSIDTPEIASARGLAESLARREDAPVAARRARFDEHHRALVRGERGLNGRPDPGPLGAPATRLRSALSRGQCAPQL